MAGHMLLVCSMSHGRCGYVAQTVISVPPPDNDSFSEYRTAAAHQQKSSDSESLEKLSDDVPAEPVLAAKQRQ
ncbi:MAG: hypothetical protein NC116_09890 [Clostridium sp.]|nr:hypothetical protein [Clostridium sp.]